MREKWKFNEGWAFEKEGESPEKVTLPHTWNAKDGTDGGNDYYRGLCWYHKKFTAPKVREDEELWIEFAGAAMSAEVWLNGKRIGCHAGGFSTFRINMTPYLQEENRLSVGVDNSKNRKVYPQKADFTFYGGIYREVYLIKVPQAHFSLDYYGSNGIKITPFVLENLQTAQITVEAWTTEEVKTVEFCIEAQKKECPVSNGYARAEFTLSDVHLWNGKQDPYLYTLEAKTDSGDIVEQKFGCRRFLMDSKKGFFLNGRSYPLCGAARHQDRAGMGNAISSKEHEEDMSIMLEMGCNTIRLAHYQHDSYFYDLCDRYGMIVWAEIPYITEHMPEANENAIQQMKELIAQNYNHPSIVCWGLSNEITATGGVNDDMIRNHQILQKLCHHMDTTRPTTMAHAFMLDMDDAFVQMSDICSYNLYYGWYLGELEQNDAFFDTFHEAHPDVVVGLSEYGADANPAYQNAHPCRGDWSETYQSLYHEHMLAMWEKRPYIWAMHVWNMFDFAADGRAEGGKPGQNQKGLVTFDRKLKKDAFYLYKAYLSDQPFVHLCGRRYVDRTEAMTEIKIYSNQSKVTLWVDGKEYGTKEGKRIFVFDIPISGKHHIEAVSGNLSDAMDIQRVEQQNPSYVYGGANVINWFDREDEIVREGYYSIKDSMEEVQKNPVTNQIVEDLLMPVLNQMTESYGDVAKGVTMPESMQKMVARMSIEGWMKQAAKFVTPELAHKINYELNQVKKGECADAATI